MEKKQFSDLTMGELFTNIKKGEIFKDFFKHTTRAAFFWNGLVYLIFISSIFINPEFTGVLVLIASIFSVACFFDDEFEKNPDRHFWPILGIPFWFMCLVGLIMIIMFSIWEFIISPFNKWLNDPYEKDWNKFDEHVNPCHNKIDDLKVEFHREYINSNSNDRKEFYLRKPKYWNKRLKDFKSK